MIIIKSLILKGTVLKRRTLLLHIEETAAWKAHKSSWLHFCMLLKKPKVYISTCIWRCRNKRTNVSQYEYLEKEPMVICIRPSVCRSITVCNPLLRDHGDNMIKRTLCEKWCVKQTYLYRKQKLVSAVFTIFDF